MPATGLARGGRKLPDFCCWMSLNTCLAEQFLQRLENSFPKLTAVVITVPTCQELWSNYDIFTGHHRRYTMDSLEELAANLNWTIKIAGYFLRISYLPMRLMAALGVDRNTRINAPSKAMRPLHRLVALLCQLEQAIIPRRIRGSSAYRCLLPAQTGAAVKLLIYAAAMKHG